MNECDSKIIGDKKNVESSSATGWTRKPIVRQMAVSSCICTSFFQTGLILGTCPVLVPQLRSEPLQDGVVIDDDKASWLCSVAGFSSIPCVILLGLMVQYLGRKLTYLFMCVTACVSFIIFYCATSFNMLIISGILYGPLFGGQTVCIMIDSEYVSPKYRGVFLAFHSTTTFWGMWMANAIGTFFHWRNIGIIGIVFGVYNTLMMTACPESPLWLASKGKIRKCREAHRWLRGTDESAEKELESLIISEMERSRKTEGVDNFCLRFLSHLKKMLSTEFYKPVGLCMLTTFMLHASGKFVLHGYAIDIITKITGNESAAYTGMLIIDGITVLGMYIGSFVSRYTKRRTFLFSTEFVAIFFLFIISLHLHLIKQEIIEENVYLSISLLLAFSLSVSIGPMILGILVIGELLPLNLRSLAAIVQCMTADGFGTVVIKFAPRLFSLIGSHGAFLCFAISSLVCALLLLKYLPETKNKTLTEIENMFKEKGKDMKELEPLAELATVGKVDNSSVYSRSYPT